MGKSEEMLRMERDLNGQPELKEKLETEIKRIAEAGEAESEGEVMVKAAAALGYSITLEELERTAADLEKLDDDELDAAGGIDGVGKDEKGRDLFCVANYHCYTVLKHSETTATFVACWKDNRCVLIKKGRYE